MELTGASRGGPSTPRGRRFHLRGGWGRLSERAPLLAIAAGAALPACAEIQVTDELWDAPQWEVERELVVGSPDEASSALTTIRTVAVDGAGRVYAMLPMEGAIAVFEPDGAPAGRIGGRGEGPGEFQGITWIGVLGDTLYALDSAVHRVSAFGLDGEVVDVRQVALPSLPEGYFPGLLSPRFPDGSIGMVPGYAADLLAQGTIRRIPILRIGGEGQALDTIAMVSQERLQMALEARDGRSFFSAEPLGDAPLYAFAPDGSRLVIVNRRAARGADDGSFEVVRVGIAGDTLSAESYRYQPERIPRVYIDSVRTSVWEAFGGDDAPFSLSRLSDAMFEPVHFPPITAVVVGSEEVWLKTWREDGDRVYWIVIGEDGEVSGKVRLPQRLIPRTIVGDDLWGMELDSLDVPYLVRYRIIRDRPAE